MIEVIQSFQRHLHTETLDALYQLRARVFKDRLNWEVDVQEGRETDYFDDCDPVYLISRNQYTGRVEGGLRLLPTTGPNMLRDVFPVLLPDGEIVESPLIWESSRFAIDPDLATDGSRRLHSVTTELLCGIVEVGMLAGIDFVVSVYDARMARIFKLANCPADVIGVPTRIGRVMTYAGLFEISEEMRGRIARAGQITGSVLLPDTNVNAVAA
ncbi:acyl-homoserine-lactone synthase [Labrys miyagiensis]|nr:acyl-homoserine-lactone synthase [Labrys miyagiensis]